MESLFKHAFGEIVPVGSPWPPEYRLKQPIFSENCLTLKGEAFSPFPDAKGCALRKQRLGLSSEYRYRVETERPTSHSLHHTWYPHREGPSDKTIWVSGTEVKRGKRGCGYEVEMETAIKGFSYFLPTLVSHKEKLSLSWSTHRSLIPSRVRG